MLSYLKTLKMIFNKGISRTVQFWILIGFAFAVSLGSSLYYQSQFTYSANATQPSIPALARGIGLSLWMFAAPDRDFSASRLDRWITEKDFKQFAAWGLTHVRLPIEPEFLQSSDAPSKLIPDRIAYVDRAIAWAKKYQLAIVLDIHPLTPLDLTAGTRSKDYDRLQQLWIALAQRYRSQSDAVFYELLNEPGVDQVATWESVAQALVNKIRAIDQHHTIIVSGNSGGGRDLEQLTPLKGEKLAYTFHFYDPMQFTHQSSGWAGDLAGLREVPYPYDAKRFETAKSRSASDPVSVRLLNSYQKKRYDKQQLEKEFRPALRFRSLYNVPVYCGEFGVNRAAPRSDRLAWNRDVIDIMQRNHFGYAFWEYRGSFGLMPFESVQPDSEMVSLIGGHRS